MKTKAWSYIRLSDPKQIEGDGDRRMTELAERFAQTHDLDLQRPFRDLGVSSFRGKNRKGRSGLAKIMGMVADGIIAPGEFLLVENCDRLSREVPHVAIEVFTNLINSGITVVTTDDGQIYNDKVMSDEPMKLVFWVLKTIRGHEESSTKAKRVTAAADRRKAEAREAGKVTTGNLPKWLFKDDKGLVKIDPRKGAVIERIFRDLDAGLGASQIAAALNDEGERPFNDYKKRETRGWHHTVILNIAKSRKVLGEHQMTRLIPGSKDKEREPDGEPLIGAYPAAITDEALFYRVQSRIRERTVKQRGGARNATKLANLFTGMAECAECGAGMILIDKHGRNKPYLRCGAATRKFQCGNRTRFICTDLETSIIRGITEIDFDNGEAQDPAAIELRLVEAKHAEADTTITNLIAVAGKSGNPDLMKAIARETERRDELAAQIAAVTQRLREVSAQYPARDRQEAVSRLFEEMRAMEGEDLLRQRVKLSTALRTVADRLVCRVDGRVKVVLAGRHGMAPRSAGGMTAEYWIEADGTHRVVRDGFWTGKGPPPKIAAVA